MQSAPPTFSSPPRPLVTGKTYRVLEKGTQDVEYQLNRLFHRGHHELHNSIMEEGRTVQSVRSKLSFLRNILGKEAEAHTKGALPSHLLQIARRLETLEEDLERWDKDKAPMNVESGFLAGPSTCSCTDSCLGMDNDRVDEEAVDMSVEDEQAVDISPEDEEEVLHCNKDGKAEKPPAVEEQTIISSQEVEMLLGSVASQEKEMQYRPDAVDDLENRELQQELKKCKRKFLPKVVKNIIVTSVTLIFAATAVLAVSNYYQEEDHYLVPT